MNFESWFKDRNPQIPISGVQAAIQLHTEGATIPFIARYRKERTGNLKDFEIQKAIESHEQWQFLLKRQSHIIAEIEKQGKLTQELKDKILSTFNEDLLEDLYLPYRKKRKTKAEAARDAGLLPLADWIWNCASGTEKPQEGQTLFIWAFTFRNEEKGITSAEQAIEGARDILVERLSEMMDLREEVRKVFLEKGIFKSVKGSKAEEKSRFDRYFDYWEAVFSLKEPKNSHRYLALRRGKQEKELAVVLDVKDEDQPALQHLHSLFENRAMAHVDSPGKTVLQEAAKLAYADYVFPSIETEILKMLKAIADDIAIQVFAKNVRTILLSAPFGPKTVMGVDPGIRTGTKISIIGSTGQFLETQLIYFETDQQKPQAQEVILDLIKKHNVEAIAVGNGTNGREAERFIRKTTKDKGIKIPVVSVSEAGASVYSASETAREEFPDLDVTVRGAISIARRLQDPLAELVKTDPKSLGVGQYQHDVNQNELKKTLEFVVESCVNNVGVNLNTASYHLLSHVSGIGPAIAKALVDYRVANGLFKSREQLLAVPSFTARTFEHSAGFLRIPESENPLDNTGVHPERYETLSKFASTLGKKVADFVGTGAEELAKSEDLKKDIGEFTLKDIVDELKKPGRDPRETFAPIEFREDISELKDLKPGMICPGVVTNVTNFGAFVDIGVHQDGLVHLSQLSEKFVEDPKEVVTPGERVKVKVLEVDLEKNQIALTIKGAREVQRPPRQDRRPQRQQHRPAPRPQRPPKPKFAHNPFAMLADLKKDLKK